MTEPLAIDADVTAALDRWVAAIGKPDHQAASTALDGLLVELCAMRREIARINTLAKHNPELSVLLLTLPSPDAAVLQRAPVPQPSVVEGQCSYCGATGEHEDYCEHAGDNPCFTPALDALIETAGELDAVVARSAQRELAVLKSVAGAPVPQNDALHEAADELESIYRREYSDGKGGIHPALQSKFDRDMDLVKRLRGAAPLREEADTERYCSHGIALKHPCIKCGPDGQGRAARSEAGPAPSQPPSRETQ